MVTKNILKYIKKLCGSSGTGQDGITPQCIKYGGQFLMDALVDIYSDMWTQGYSPNQMRQAWISPTWKDTDKLLTSSYRPIALTNHLSKIFEGVIREQILDHHKDISMDDPTEHDSQKGKSTITQLLAQIAIILDSCLQ